MTADAVRVVTLLEGEASLAVAATSERAGGVSAGPLGALNVGFRAADLALRVRENRRRLAASLGIRAEDLTCGRQVHGSCVAVVTEADRGRGATGSSEAIPACDALVTAVPGLPLLVLSADCPVVVITDRKRPALGVAHAGWRGLLGGVLERTVEALVSALGARPRALRSAISPCIGPCCYEVGEDLRESGRRSVSDFDRFLVRGPGPRPHLDLPALARALLARAGLDPSAVSGPPACTRCRSEAFFSHRASAGACGLMGTVAAIRVR